MIAATAVCCALAGAVPPGHVAKVQAVFGPVTVQRGSRSGEALAYGQQVTSDSVVTTGPLGSARLDLDRGVSVQVSDGAAVRVSAAVELERGTAWVHVAAGTTPRAALELEVSPGRRAQVTAATEEAVLARLTRTEAGIELAAITGALSVEGRPTPVSAGHFAQLRGDGTGDEGTLPEAPVPVAPERDARFLCDALIVGFKWAEVPGATAYRLELAQDPGFQSLVLSRELKSPGFVYLPTAPGRYVYRVSARGAEGRWSPPSEARPLHCEKDAPRDYLVAPVRGTVLHYRGKPPPISFSWVAAPNSPSYRLVVARGRDLLATAAFQRQTNEPKATLAELPDGDYWWGVYLEDALPYPLFVEPRALSIHKGAVNAVGAPKLIKDWGR